MQNPALDAFVQDVPEALSFAQVLVRRQGGGFELRHVADGGAAAEELKGVSLSDLREIAQFSATGQFRPLKSSPNLRTGWRISLANPGELGAALNWLYPGGVADWHAVRREPHPPVTNYREFTDRQTGMYRITTLLSDAQAADVIRAGCHRRFCLKQRLWTVSGLAPDPIEEKSVLPCLEPCPVLLEFARKATRLEQEEKLPVRLAPSDLVATANGLEAALEHPNPNLREADFNSPENPRRLQLALEKLRDAFASAKPSGPE